MAGRSKSAQTREKVALALASGESVPEAAAGAGCTERTVFRWLSEDTEFNRLITSIHEELLEQSMSLLVQAQQRAARRLLNMLGDRNKRIALGAVKIALAWRESLVARVTERLEELRRIAVEETRDRDPEAFDAEMARQQDAARQRQQENIDLMNILLRGAGGQNGHAKN